MLVKGSHHHASVMAEQDYPCVAWLPTAVIVMCPIVESALAPCQCRSPALMHDVAYIYLTLLMLSRHHTGA